MFEHIDVVAAAVVIAGAIFNSGILVATLKSHGRKLEEHDIKHKEHDAKLEAHGNTLAVLQAWHDGHAARN